MSKFWLTLGLFFVLTPSAFAQQPFEVEEISSIKAPPAKVFAVVADFSAMDWNPLVDKVEIVEGVKDQPGAVHVVTLKDGTTIKERLVTYSPAEMVFTTEVIETSLPVDQYSATVSVKEEAGSAIVTWTGNFVSDNPADAKSTAKIIQDFYRQGFVNLALLLQKQ